jgi:hypothetical protein
MPCLIVLIALISPRFALFLMLIFSDRLGDAYDGVALPILGFFFLPWTTFIYALAWTPNGGVDTIGWVFVVFGLLLDLGSWGTGPLSRRRRMDPIG